MFVPSVPTPPPPPPLPPPPLPPLSPLPVAPAVAAILVQCRQLLFHLHPCPNNPDCPCNPGSGCLICLACQNSMCLNLFFVNNYIILVFVTFLLQNNMLELLMIVNNGQQQQHHWRDERRHDRPLWPQKTRKLWHRPWQKLDRLERIYYNHERFQCTVTVFLRILIFFLKSAIILY